MVLIVIAIVVLGAVIIYGWIKLMSALFNPAIRKLERKKMRLAKADNPYIQAHRLKIQNDSMYDEYLEWLDKNGGDIPFEKWKTAEERKFDQKIENATFTRWRPNK